jgi:NADH dehydrogenase
MVDIDRTNQEVITETKKKYNYDALILALGVQTNFFHIKGLEEYSFGVKTIDDAERLKRHLHMQIVDEQRPDHNYVIVGGGPTGIELAGVLPQYIHKLIRKHNLPDKPVHVDLIEALPRLLPRSSKKLSKKVSKHLKRNGVKILLNTAVKAESADELMVNNKPIRSHSVIWTAGMSNDSFFSKHDFQLSDKGRVRVDQFLQAEPGIYVIGDNADTPYTGMAQTAIYDGNFVAHNIERLAENKEVIPYKAKRPIYVFAAGKNWAAVRWGHLEFYGRIGSLIRRLADLAGFHDYEPWKLATSKFIEEYEDEDDCPHCEKKSIKDTKK